MHALDVLEFRAVREQLATHAETPLAVELAQNLLPEFEPARVWSRLAYTEEAFELLAKDMPPSLKPVRDLRQVWRRAQKGGVLGGLELHQCADALRAMRTLRHFLHGKRELCPLLWALADPLPEAPRLEDAVFDAVDADGEVKESASAELGQIRRRKHGAHTAIIERIQSYVTGKARDLLSDPIYTQRDGRFVIPLKAEHKGKIRGIVHDTSGSGQTIYVEPEDVLQLGNRLRELEGAEREEIQRILAKLSGKVGAVADQAIPGLELAAEIDFHLAKARYGYAVQGAIPRKAERPGIRILRGRHPLLDPKIVVPIDVEVGFEMTGLLITGPNTGGKTVGMKMVGLAAVMAQSGLMPPASDVEIGVFSQFWADIGDEQSLQQSLSTFSAHIRNISDALKGLKAGALVLLDEIGAGTDPAEGAALARALLLRIQEKGAVVLASTHYGELKAFAYNQPGFQNAAMEFDQRTLRPTYRLIMGAPGASHALKIAERYGIPRDVVEAAREGLSTQDQDVANMLEKLELAERRARLAQSEADRRANELRKLQAEAERKLAEAEEIRRTVNARANERIETALREIRLEAQRVFEELKKAPRDPKANESARRDLKALQQMGQEAAAAFAPEARRPEDIPDLRKGMHVRVEGYAQNGVLLEDPKEGVVLVQMGVLKLKMPVHMLRPMAKAPEPTRTQGRVSNQLQRRMSAGMEIHLRAMRADEAVEQLDRYLDEAVLAGLEKIRIVHGKGGGVLRQVTQDFLRKHPHVDSFRDAEPAEGGQGVTIAELK